MRKCFRILTMKYLIRQENFPYGKIWIEQQGENPKKPLVICSQQVLNCFCEKLSGIPFWYA
jgi:hypothetical protein